MHPAGQPVCRNGLRHARLVREEPRRLEEDLAVGGRKVPQGSEVFTRPVESYQTRRQRSAEHRRQAQRGLYPDGAALRQGGPGPDDPHLDALRPGLRLQPVQRRRRPIHHHGVREGPRAVQVGAEPQGEVQPHALQLPHPDRGFEEAGPAGRPAERRTDREGGRRRRGLRHPGGRASAQQARALLGSGPDRRQHVYRR